MKTTRSKKSRPDDPPPMIHCRPVYLPDDLIVPAAREAIRINPANAPMGRGTAGMTAPHIAGLTSAFWRPGDTITWAFIDGANAAVRRLFAEACARWMRCCNLRLVESSQSPICRITRDPRKGHYSYIGVGQPPTGETMNLAGFTEATSAAEWERVADHEIGHLLGLIHGQKTKWLTDGFDRAGCYAEFGGPPNNWPPSLIESEILTPENMSLLTDFGPQGLELSITTYPFSARCRKDRIPIPGGTRITAKDADDVRRIYGPTGGAVDPDPGPDPGGPPPDPDPIDVPPPGDSIVLFRGWAEVKTIPYRPGLTVTAVLPFLVLRRPVSVRVQDDVAPATPVVQLIPPGQAPIDMEMRSGETAAVQVSRQYRVSGQCQVKVRFEGAKMPTKFRLSAYRI